MKKTLTVNLNGRVFNIDEDAYQLLDKYLRNLRIYFRNEEGSTEILADFEARIEELLSDRVRLGYNVISIDEVEKVIAQMGRPDDFGTKEEKETTEHHAKTEFYTPARKRLYRNPADKMLGGLCSGLAAYFNMEVNLVRIIAVILIFGTSLWIVPVYLIAWIFVPEARTAEQKLEMQGKPITVENIGKTVAANTETDKQNNKKGCVGAFLDFIVAFFKVCLVGMGCLVGLPLIFALVVVIIVLFATIFGVGTGFLGAVIPWSNNSPVLIAHPAWATVAFCLIIGIPLIALVYAIVAYLMKLKPVHKSVKWVGLIAWVAAIVLFAFSGFKVNWSEISEKNDWHIGYTMKEIQGNGVLSDRSEIMPAIDEFELSGTLEIALQVEASPDDKTHLLINTDSNIIDKIMVEKNGNSLNLRNTKRWNLKPSSPIIVHLQTPKLKSIETNGASKAEVSGNFNTDELDATVSGVSKLTINELNLNGLDAEASGVGELTLAGTAKKADMDASGTAKIHAFDLVADTVNAETSGVSEVSCNPTEYLKGEASGASKVFYKQEPKIKSISTSGVAEVTKH
ncbi:hypothetical protein AGMMS50262_10480 [Bacteroidia bacterium]|nr:hypothetical protein AGMMS50262_10480 [Bacteroidia bacterium]